MTDLESLSDYIHELEDQLDHCRTMHRKAIDQLKFAAEVIEQLREELSELRKSSNIDSDEELPSLLRRQV